jgi:hypothetical protein
MGNKLLRVLVSRDKMIFDKLYQSIGVTVRLVVEIETISCLLNTNCFLVSFMAQNELLEI